MILTYRKKLLFLILIASSLLVIAFTLQYQQQTERGQSLPLVATEMLEDEFFLPSAILENVENIHIIQFKNESSIHFITQNNRWIFAESELPLEEIFILQLIQTLEQIPLKVLPFDPMVEDATMTLTPYYQITLQNHLQDYLTLTIAQPNASQSAHYAYFNENPKKLFLIDMLIVNLIARPISSYYAVLLPKLQEKAIKSFNLTNRLGTITFEYHPSPEFFSKYSWVEPYNNYTVDQARLHQEFLKWWQNRTPINVIYNYQPYPDPLLLSESGLKEPQARLFIRHQDNSMFTILVGNLADAHHFYAKEIDNPAIWLLPDDLAKNLLNLNAFSLVSRAIMLPEITQVTKIELLADNEYYSWESRNQQFLINNHPVDSDLASNLYQNILSLHYEAEANLSTQSQEAITLYQLIWYCKNKEQVLVAFTSYDDTYLSVMINEVKTPFIIGKYQLEALVKEWLKN